MPNTLNDKTLEFLLGIVDAPFDHATRNLAVQVLTENPDRTIRQEGDLRQLLRQMVVEHTKLKREHDNLRLRYDLDLANAGDKLGESLANYRQLTQKVELLERKEMEYKKENERLTREASTDDLVDLMLKRKAFESKAEASFEFAKRHKDSLSLIQLDIDHFKRVNDTYGHPIGDAMIQILGYILLKKEYTRRDGPLENEFSCNGGVRSYDTVARVGGEEFAILLPKTDLVLATRVAERLRKAVQSCSANPSWCQDVLQKYFKYANPPHRGLIPPITLSMGISCFDGREDSRIKEFAHLYQAADSALYDAKHAGRNRVRVSDPNAGIVSDL